MGKEPPITPSQKTAIREYVRHGVLEPSKDYFTMSQAEAAKIIREVTKKMLGEANKKQSERPIQPGQIELIREAVKVGIIPEINYAEYKHFDEKSASEFIEKHVNPRMEANEPASSEQLLKLKELIKDGYLHPLTAEELKKCNVKEALGLLVIGKTRKLEGIKVNKTKSGMEPER
ncbi:MAG: hypothetical protein PHX61_13065 [Alphaproteobacteria bacterium]|nr:hypothetical protein [Alphaproteobacteria bacterium]